MARTRAGDHVVAENTWTKCCAKCLRKIDPHENAEIGHCPHCGHIFSQMRLLTRQEAREFLRGRFVGTIKIDGREHLRDVNRGIEDLQPEYLEKMRHVLQQVREAQQSRIAFRRKAALREEAVRSPVVARFLKRAERNLHGLLEKIRPPRRFF